MAPRNDALPALLIVIITIFRTYTALDPFPLPAFSFPFQFSLTYQPIPVPPAGVFLVAGCGADLLINICLTILGYLPGHIHAFYLEYVYFDRRNRGVQLGTGQRGDRAPGVYSENVQSGGRTEYGTV